MQTLLQCLLKPFKLLHSRQDKGKQKPIESPDLLDLDLLDESDATVLRSSDQYKLPVIVDGEPSKMKMREEREHEFWNSVLLEGDEKPKSKSQKRRRQYKTLGEEDVKGMEQAESSKVMSNVRDPVEVEGIEYQMREARDFYEPTGYKGKGKEKVVEVEKEPSVSKHGNLPKMTEEAKKQTVDEYFDFPDFDHLSNISSQPSSIYGSSQSSSTIRPTISREVLKTGSDSTTASFPTVPQSSLTSLTWNVALSRILSSGYIDPEMLEAIQERAISISSGVSGNELISMTHVGLVPNFSRPIAGAAWYDRVLLPEIPDPFANASHSSQESLLLPNNPHLEHGILCNGIIPDPTILPNGILTHTRMPTPPEYTLPTGLPSAEEFILLAPAPPSRPTSSATQLKLYEGTIATQVKLIQDLQTLCDGLREENEDLHSQQVLTKHALHGLDDDVARFKVVLENMKDEIVGLKIAVDFGNKTLGGCWAREWDLWKTMCELRNRSSGGRIHNGFFQKLFKVSKERNLREDLEKGVFPEGYEWDNFGYGHDAQSTKEPAVLSRMNEPHSRPVFPNHQSWAEDSVAGRTSLSAGEIDAIVEIAEQNVKILKEDIGDMVQLVQGCKKRSARIQDIKRNMEEEEEEERRGRPRVRN